MPFYPQNYPQKIRVGFDTPAPDVGGSLAGLDIISIFTVIWLQKNNIFQYFCLNLNIST
jgi:hypothetical protein